MGQVLSDLSARASEIRPPAPDFSELDIPDLKGKTFLVTGGNVGLGEYTSKVLVSHGARVLLCARSPDKGEAAVAAIREATGRDAIVFQRLDLGDLKSVKASAQSIVAREKRLDCVILNAGVMVPPLQSKTHDGLELQFGTNVVGHVALFLHLVPLLRQTAEATQTDARVVVLSSSGHELAPPGGIMLDDLFLEKYWYLPAYVRRWLLYGQSKLGDVLMAKEIAQRYSKDGILAVSLNPGNIRTALTRHTLPDIGADIGAFLGLLHPVEKGALTQLFCATAPITMADTGTYFIPFARKGKAYRREAYDMGLSKRIWEYCEACMRQADAAVDS